MSGTQSFKSIDEMSEDDRQSVSTPIVARGGLLNTSEDIYTVASSDNLSEKSEDDFSDT